MVGEKHTGHWGLLTQVKNSFLNHLSRSKSQPIDQWKEGLEWSAGSETDLRRARIMQS